MNEKDESRLRDMLDAARRDVKFAEGKTRESLEADDMLLGFAVVRAIEIVGEAASQITKETRDGLTGVRWHEIIGMRNRIVHDYLNVDYDIVWTVATINMPEIIDALEKVISED